MIRHTTHHQPGPTKEVTSGRYPAISGWLVSLGILLLSACQTDDEVSLPGQDLDIRFQQEYFLAISLGSEMANIPEQVKKWDQDLLIYTAGTVESELDQELDRIIDEINQLSEGIQLQRVSRQDESNYLIYFGDRHTYVNEYEPNAAALVNNNFGVFWIYWDSGFNIYRGSMYVDTERTETLDCRKHLLREELTQSLGLMQDTGDYPTSIFYSLWTCGDEYAPVDRQLIRWQLSSEIEAGMTRDDITQLWGS